MTNWAKRFAAGDISRSFGMAIPIRTLKGGSRGRYTTPLVNALPMMALVQGSENSSA